MIRLGARVGLARNGRAKILSLRSKPLKLFLNSVFILLLRDPARRASRPRREEDFLSLRSTPLEILLNTDRGHAVVSLAARELDSLGMGRGEFLSLVFHSTDVPLISANDQLLKRYGDNSAEAFESDSKLCGQTS